MSLSGEEPAAVELSMAGESHYSHFPAPSTYGTLQESPSRSPVRIPQHRFESHDRPRIWVPGEGQERYRLCENTAFFQNYDFSNSFTRRTEPAHQGEVEAEFTPKLRIVEMKTDMERRPEAVLESMAKHADDFVDMPIMKQVLLSMMGGSFITFGALLSVFLSDGIAIAGPQTLMTAFGFVMGFSMVILTGAALYTEINVIVPVKYLSFSFSSKLVMFHFICFAGNVAGSLFVACLVSGADLLLESQQIRLSVILVSKLRLAHKGPGAWFQILVSGILGNWLVGLAAFFAKTARTLPGKIIGLAIPVITFVGVGVQHSPANMGYMNLGLIACPGCEITWSEAFLWNIIPAGIGNLIGAALFVSLLLWFIYIHNSRVMLVKKGV